jgi:hypothetical protein
MTDRDGPPGSSVTRVQTLREGILLAWNPSFQPETIRAHVEAHRRSPDRITWWARLALGTSQEYSIAPVEEAMRLMERSPEERPVFVTDYVRLHALRVDHVQSERPSSGVPDYYAKFG